MKLQTLTKILSLVMVVAMMGAMLAACGGGENADDTAANVANNNLSYKAEEYTPIESNTDFDTLLTAGQYRVSSAASAATMKNCPAEMAGTLRVEETIADTRLYQTFYGNTGNTAVYFRYYSGSKWGEWKKVAYEDDVNSSINTAMKDTLPILSMYDHIECIGDSLTYSAVYTASDKYRPAYVTYPKALEKLTGTPVTQLATCSFDPREWWDEYNREIKERPNQLVIMYLGTNGGLSDTLDTDAPADAPPATWKNSNTGKYARIINAYKEVGAKIVLVKCYKSSKDVPTVNSVIEKLAERFECAVVENEYFAEDLYHYFPDGTGKNGLHYNDLGYMQFAKQLIININTLPEKYMLRIMPD